ncbi:uncharacterized protein ACA1_039520 [Acanthamoeba castellanii str. Neff]|uniref:Uncharacterized protein n=1 Tax=Acanthamoeba castellanii (strain ATCC 30010 / Neff) TaxID=1257118 RepID=L8HGY5_ACACF|nr:uncharacterized protein ACA1_039520 [Acanthamoeba castellanii str. Neff]ELR24430.1 hypothetical protein ACA1_039520 [Acanthamoeba castellanii str. Neff]
MQYDFTWLVMRLTPAEKRATLASELAYFFPPQQALSFLFFSAEREKPRLRSTAPSVVFASSWLRIRCRPMLQHALRSMLTDRSWLQHNSYDTSLSDVRQSRQSGLNLRKVCATFFDAVFKSADRYPLCCATAQRVRLTANIELGPPVGDRECRLYLRNVLSRTGQYYCKKREKKERKQEAKREREVQRAEKIRLYSAQAAAKKLNGSSSGGAMGDGSGIYYCGTAGEELIGVVLSDEDEREASLNASVGDACVDASKDDDDEDEEEKSDNREEDKVHNMLPIISHLGFKRVWNAFTTPEDFELLPYGSLDGSAHDKLRCIFSAMETLVGQFYAASPEYPAWADKEWVDSLKQDYTKYLLTISSAGHNELDNVESLLQKRTDRLFEAGRAMEQLDKYIFSCLMNKQLHIKLRGPRKFKCMRKRLWDLYGGVQASIKVLSMQCPSKLRPFKADFVELKTAPHCISMVGQDTVLFTDEKEVTGLEWKNRMYPLHGDVKHLIFTFLFMRKEEGTPVLKAKAHFRLERRRILKEKRETLEVSLQLLCEDRDELRDKKLGGMLRNMLSGGFQRPRRLTDQERVGELRVELHYDRKFVGRRERCWGTDDNAPNPDEESEQPVPHGIFPPFVIL